MAAMDYLLGEVNRMANSCEKAISQADFGYAKAEVDSDIRSMGYWSGIRMEAELRKRDIENVAFVVNAILEQNLVQEL
jgi:hypothetical protein